MAHFAKLDENNIVLKVVVVANSDTADENGIENEEIGIQFLKSFLGENTRWKQTSYNNNIRVRYAGIGYIYDEILDAFIPPKPFESWILNQENLDWDPPIPCPELTQEQIDQGYYYEWNEESYVSTSQGWVIVELSEIITEQE
jgi:hypothetical protein